MLNHPVLKNGYFLALLTAIISGVSVFANGVAVKLTDPVEYTLLKNVGALVFLFVLIALIGLFNQIRSLKKSQIFSLILIGLIGGSIPFMLFFSGLKMGGASVSSFIYRSLFIFCGISAYFILKERPSKNELLCGFLILVANALLVDYSQGFSIPQILVLLATILWAVEYALSKKLTSSISPLIVALGRMFFGSLFIVAYLFATDSTPLSFNLSSEILISLVATSFTLFMFLGFWYTSLSKIKLTTASIILTLGGSITALLDGLIVHKKFAQIELFSLLCISVCALYLFAKTYPPNSSPGVNADG